ncbi:MAG: glycosyltransferase [bacterium]|nr:glycosyltransferase [bacterium]
MTNMESASFAKTNIIVTCWNALEYTKITLSCLFDTVHHAFFLTIVDNGSIDGTHEYLKTLKVPSNCKKYTLITNVRNLGAGTAINQGQKVSQELGVKYSCLCNNDLFFQDAWLELLEFEMDKDETLGILGTLRPAVWAKHHTSNQLSKTVVDDTPQEFSIKQELERFQDGHSFEETGKMMVKINGGGVKYLRCPPDAVVTCCALIRNTVSGKIGYFSDSIFKIYGSEDIDLSWRLHAVGYKCAILMDVYVHHFRHKSTKASNLNRDKYLSENNFRLYNKWKQTIFDFLTSEENRGVKLEDKFSSEEDGEYFFFRKIQEKINFLAEYNKNE